MVGTLGAWPVGPGHIYGSASLCLVGRRWLRMGAAGVFDDALQLRLAWKVTTRRAAMGAGFPFLGLRPGKSGFARNLEIAETRQLDGVSAREHTRISSRKVSTMSWPRACL